MDQLLFNIIWRAVELKIAGGGGSSSSQDFPVVVVLLPTKIKRYRMEAVCLEDGVKCYFYSYIKHAFRYWIPRARRTTRNR